MKVAALKLNIDVCNAAFSLYSFSLNLIFRTIATFNPSGLKSAFFFTNLVQKMRSHEVSFVQTTIWSHKVDPWLSQV